MVSSVNIAVPIVEECETRILYSADVQAIMHGSADLTLAASRGEANLRQEIVFIDSAVAGYAQLAGSISSAAPDNRTPEVVILDRERDGISQVSAVLRARSGLDAIHIVSHGAPGMLQIGDTRLNLDTLPQNAIALSTWGNALSAQGDILLYGCAVAESEAGKELLRELGVLTGADVAASTDLTGNPAAGGNWLLEYRSGSIETSVAADESVRAAWPGQLASYTVTSTADSGPGTLRQAIIDANIHPGADTIAFDISGEQAIRPVNALPRIADMVSIDGSTQPGYTGGMRIALDGAGTQSGHGLVFDAGAAGSMLKGLDIRAFAWDGVDILGVPDITIQDNTIRGNGGVGILVFGAAGQVLIGGVDGGGNTISGNGGAGVVIYSNSAAGIHVAANAIFDNGGLAIDLGRADGVTQNDAGDRDSGPNALQNFPVLNEAIQGGAEVVIGGVLESRPAGAYRLEFFASAHRDASGYGEAERFLGAATVQADSAGMAAFRLKLPGTVAPGEWVSATATDLSAGNTSEFSGALAASPSHPPTGADTTVSTPEDATYIFSTADFGFGDADGDRLSGVRIATLASAGMLYRNGFPVKAGEIIARADIDQGRFTFRAEENATGDTYASFDFQVQDDGLVSLDLQARRMTIAVMPVNDAPAGSNTTVTAIEDIPYRFTATDFGFSDPDGNAFATLTLSTLPQAGSLRIGTTAVAAGDQLRIADIEAGRLTYLAAENASGDAYATFAFQVGDDGGTDFGGVDRDLQPRTMRIDVKPVNDAPAARDGMGNLFESESYVFKIGDFGFRDIDDNRLLSVHLASVPAFGVLTRGDLVLAAGDFVPSKEIEQGQMRFTPAAGKSGAEQFQFHVRDDGGEEDGGKSLSAVPNVFMLRIAPVKHAPQGTDGEIHLDEDTTYVLKVEDFGFRDIDADRLASVTITALPGAGKLYLSDREIIAGSAVTTAEIDAGLLIYTPAANDYGASYASFAFQVKDDGGAAHGGRDEDASPNVLTFHVAAVGDPPESRDKSLSIQEDTNHIFQLADFDFSDADGDALAGVRILSLPAAGQMLLHGAPVAAGDFVDRAAIASGDLVFVPAPNAYGTPYARMRFTVIDSSDAAVPDASPNEIVLHVGAVDDLPTIEVPASGKRFTGSELAFSAALGNRLHVSDIDADATQGKLVLSVDHGMLILGRQTASTIILDGTIAEIDAALADLRYLPSPTFSGNVEVQVKLSEEGKSGGLVVSERTFDFLWQAQAGMQTEYNPTSPDAAAGGTGSTANGVAQASSATVTGTTGSASSGTGKSTGQIAQAIRSAPEDIFPAVELRFDAGQQAALAAMQPVQAVVGAKADAGAAQVLRIAMPTASAASETAGEEGASQHNALSVDAIFLKVQKSKLNLVLHPGASSAEGQSADQRGGIVLNLNDGGTAGKISADAIEATGILLSLGTMWLLVGKSALLTSLLAGMPAWQRIDPLHVIGGDAGAAGNEEGDMAGVADDLFGDPASQGGKDG